MKNGTELHSHVFIFTVAVVQSVINIPLLHNPFSLLTLPYSILYPTINLACSAHVLNHFKDGQPKVSLLADLLPVGMDEVQCGPSMDL